MLRDQKVSIPAGKTVQLFVNADYLRIKTANIPFRFSTKNGDDFEIKQGDEVSINSFEYVYIKNESASDEVIDLFTGKNERVGSAELSGSLNLSAPVEVSNFPDNGANAVQSLKTVTNASAQLLPANPNRKYLLIQNKDLAGIIYLNVSGAATIANGLPLKPNDVYTFEGFQLYNEFRAIGDIANNPNILVIEA